MEQLQEWFEESRLLKVFTFRDHEFTIFNGFKITHYFEEDSYSIQDTRHSDFYSEVSQVDLDTLREFGFIKGAKTITYRRSCIRVDEYLRSIEDLYKKRAKYKESLPKNKAFYTKRIRNCNKNIHDNHDMLQFYQSKVEQFESTETI